MRVPTPEQLAIMRFAEAHSSLVLVEWPGRAFLARIRIGGTPSWRVPVQDMPRPFTPDAPLMDDRTLRTVDIRCASIYELTSPGQPSWLYTLGDVDRDADDVCEASMRIRRDLFLDTGSPMFLSALACVVGERWSAGSAPPEPKDTTTPDVPAAPRPAATVAAQCYVCDAPTTARTAWGTPCCALCARTI